MADRIPVFCPHCDARYSAPSQLADAANVIVLCSLCGEATKIERLGAPSAEPEQPSARPTDGEIRPRVVVAHEQPGACRTLASVLRHGGFEPLIVSDGAQALAACDRTMVTGVAALVMDVAIPGVLVFEVIAQLRADPLTAGLPVILLASVFERTRYKRRPKDLYGASGYLELHHVPDRLVPLIASLVDETTLDMAHRQSPDERAWAAPFRTRVQIESPEGREILARRLVSDIALYRAGELRAGIRSEEPLEFVRDAIDEARTKFLGMCRSQDATPVFERAVEDFRARLLARGAASG